MIGIELETVRNIALGIAAGAVVLAVVFAIVLRAIVAKLVTVGLLVAVAALVWWQRGALQDCADRVGQTLSAGSTATCTFFGRDVNVDSPLG